MTTHKDWVLTATGDSLRGVARTLGINEGNFVTRVGKGLDADRVIEIAYAYDLDPVKALRDTGHLRPETDAPTVDNILDRMLDLAEQAKKQLNADDYDLVADSSPDEDALRGDNEWP